ncbi:acyltransferase family protein [Mycolicibacterium sp. ELW1]|uniref:acyltransferase family protein n=1 Tax=Mycobacteriaceae TaxID=1762 RepID=UPI0011EBEFB6|nr:acyltransferase family protein [Mycobacterium sp. ELW1]QEN13256.1 acyltransferase [Mycobacterium sp. ELW1]
MSAFGKLTAANVPQCLDSEGRVSKKAALGKKKVTVRQTDSISPSQEVQDRRPVLKDFRPDIEGLRGFTLLAILGFHAAIPGVGGGFVGPDVFFIISGFVITGQLWHQLNKTGTLKLRSFYGSRARRLLPVAATVIVVTLLASAAILSPLQARTVMGDGIASALYVGNYWFVFQNVDYFANHEPSPFEHYWTLGVEEQFYMFWPLTLLAVAWLVRRVRPRKTAEKGLSKRPFMVVFGLIVVLSFLSSFVETYLMQAVAYFSTHTRAWDLAIGGMLALSADRWRRLPPKAAWVIGSGGLALLLLVCNQFPATIPYPGSAALLPMIATVMVIGAGCALPTRGAGRVLGWGPMRTIGRLSYSWYLWHWPVLVLVPIVLGHPLGLAGRVALVIASGLLGVLTFRYVETPLRYAARLQRSPKLSLALGGTFTALAACVGLVLLTVVQPPVGRGSPAAALTITTVPVPPGSSIAAYDAAIEQAFAQTQTAVAKSVDLQVVPSNLDPSLAGVATELQDIYFGGCLRSPLEQGHAECATGDTSSSTTVAVVGDSNAAMFFPAFQQVVAQRHWRLLMLAKGNCPMINLPNNGLLGRLAEHAQHCQEWRGQILARLLAAPPQLVVVSMWRGFGTGEALTGFHAYDSVWLDSLTHLVQQLRKAGSKVLVLGPIPSAGRINVPTCVSGHLFDVSACGLSKAKAFNPSGMSAEAASTEAAGGTYADLTDLYCAADRCPAIVGNNLVYLDKTHMTLAYSRTLGPALGALADRALAQK